MPKLRCVSTWPPVVLRRQSVLLYVASHFTVYIVWRSFCILSVLVAGVARPGRFTPEETAHSNHSTEGWVALGFGLNVLRKRTPGVPTGFRSIVLTVNS